MTGNPRTLHKYTVVMPKHCFLVLKSDYVASTSLMRGHLCSPRCRTCLRAMCLGTTQTKRARKHMCENQWKRGAWKTPWKKQVRAWKPREKNVAPNHYKTRHLARHFCHAIFPPAHVFSTQFFTHPYSEVFTHVYFADSTWTNTSTSRLNTSGYKEDRAIWLLDNYYICTRVWERSYEYNDALICAHMYVIAYVNNRAARKCNQWYVQVAGAPPEL